jgi:AraC family transcriptional regulator
MLTYSLRANAALRTHVKESSPFGRNQPGSARAAVVLSMDRHLGSSQGEEAPRERGALTLWSRNGIVDVDRAVDIFPANAVNRRAVNWNGVKVEVVQVTSRDRIEFAFRAPFHLLIAYEQGIRRDGETFVEGLPTSKLREMQRRLTFVPAGHEYREWLEAQTLGRIAYFYFDPGKMPFPLEASPAATSLAPRLFFEDRMLWESTIKAAALVETGSTNRLYCEALGTVLAHEVVRLNAEARRPNPPVRGGLAAWQQRIVTNYIEQHLAEPISLARLAQLVRLSVYHFCRAFKTSFGVPPHRYHNIRRIERAKSLLAKPACSVTEIGLMIGFSETSSFTAAFRRMTGSTPTAYRRSVE